MDILHLGTTMESIGPSAEGIAAQPDETPESLGKRIMDTFPLGTWAAITRSREWTIVHPVDSEEEATEKVREGENHQRHSNPDRPTVLYSAEYLELDGLSVVANYRTGRPPEAEASTT